MYKSEAEANTDTVMNRFNISGAEVLPDIDAGKGRYIINLTLASQGEEAIRLTFEEVSVLLHNIAYITQLLSLYLTYTLRCWGNQGKLYSTTVV